MHIKDSTSIDDHLRRAIKADFFLSEEISLPPEVVRSVRISADSDPKALRPWWKLQLNRVKGVVNSAADLQTIWNNATPTSIKPATGRLQTVALAFLLTTFDLGGEKWIKQFTYGFPLIGTYPRKVCTLVTHPANLRHPYGAFGKARRRGFPFAQNPLATSMSKHYGARLLNKSGSDGLVTLYPSIHPGMWPPSRRIA